jgi:hypothetical protein
LRIQIWKATVKHLSFQFPSPLSPVPFHSFGEKLPFISNRIMSSPVFITQEENLHALMEEETTRDKDGFPQLPISSAARAFCDLTAPANKGDIKVKAHYRRHRRPFKKLTVKKSKQSTLQQWLSSSPPPKQLASLGSNKRQPSMKPNPPSTHNSEKDDHSFAISLHIKEMRDVLSASRIINGSSPPS